MTSPYGGPPSLTGLDAHDVETTIRTLQAITARATSTTTEESS